MTLVYPTHTLVFIVLFMLAAGAATWLALAQGLPPRTRTVWLTGAAVVLGGWLLARLALAIYPPGGGVDFLPVTATSFGLPILLGVGALALSPTFRQIVRAVPQRWLIGAQATRVGGFIFLALLDMGRLPAEFALPAGYGDVTVGVLALLTVFALANHTRYTRSLIIGVNVLGLLDFAVALITGPTAIAPFAAELAAAGVSPLYINYVLVVPSFGVPLYTLLHVYSVYQLLWRPTSDAHVAQRPSIRMALP